MESQRGVAPGMGSLLVLSSPLLQLPMLDKAPDRLLCDGHPPCPDSGTLEESPLCHAALETLIEGPPCLRVVLGS